MSRVRLLAILFLAFPAPIPSASAFGLNDLISVGINVGGKVVGAAVDKAKDSLRDPEAEKAKEEEQRRKMVEAYQKQVDAIESRTDLTPLQREKLVLTLQKQYAKVEEMRQFIALSEQRQREERDKIFTAQGLASATGSAILSSPSMVMARADMAVKAGEPQAQTRRVLSQIDDKGNRTVPLVQPDKAQISGQMNQAMQKASEANQAEMQATLEEAKAKAESIPVSAPQQSDFFAQDKSKKVFVTFSGSEKLTSALQDALRARGYTLAEKAEEADVTYWFGGEYGINESAQYEGLQRDVGALYDSPQPIDPPREKMKGKVAGLLGKTFAALGGVQVQQPSSANGFNQYVIAVASRQIAGEKETRVSSVARAEDSKLLAPTMISQAMTDLLGKVGLSDSVKLAGLHY